MAKGCLFAAEAMDLKPYLTTPDPHKLHEALRRIVTIKPGMHHVSTHQTDHDPFAMNCVGG